MAEDKPRYRIIERDGRWWVIGDNREAQFGPFDDAISAGEAARAVIIAEAEKKFRWPGSWPTKSPSK